MVITGATSGIGLTTARMAAKLGANLVLAARNGGALDQLASQGAKVVTVVGKVGKEEDVARIARCAVERFGHFDTWVNNAGISVYGRLDEVDMEDFVACSIPISRAWCTLRAKRSSTSKSMRRRPDQPRQRGVGSGDTAA